MVRLVVRVGKGRGGCAGYDGNDGTAKQRNNLRRAEFGMVQVGG